MVRFYSSGPGGSCFAVLEDPRRIGSSEIRTRDSFCYNAFQKHRFQPLSHRPFFLAGYSFDYRRYPPGGHAYPFNKRMNSMEIVPRVRE